MTDSSYQRTILDNGIRIVTERMPHLKSVALGIWFDVGSRYETPAENGISHFIEHMFFKGTEKRSAKEIAVSLESLGGFLNAFTSRENTCYHSQNLDEHLDIAFDVLSDIVTSSLLKKEEIERERKVILEEIKDMEDNPNQLAMEYFFNDFWQPHPLSQSVIGKPATVSALRQENFLDYIKHNYTNNRVVVSAAGNLEHQELVAKVEQKLKLSEFSQPITVSPPKTANAIRKIVNRKTAQTHLCMGFPTIPFTDDRRYILLVINIILGGGMSSRLFQSVRERHGLCYTIYAFQSFYHDAGLFGIYLGTTASQVVQAINLVLEELNKICQEQISDQELENAKSQLKGSTALALEGSFARMERVARQELFLGKFVSLEEAIEDIAKITKEDVQKLCQTYFKEQLLGFLALGDLEDSVIDEIDWSILE